MRNALIDKRQLSQSSTLVEIAAPIGGWNTESGLATMPPIDAILMDNFTPQEFGVSLRKGDELFASGMSGDVETLTEFVSPTVNQLLAASDGNVYNITSGSPVIVGSGFTNARWQTENYQGYAFFANGDDTVQRWDGSTLANSTFTGVTLSELINVSQVRNRLWFVRKDTAEAYYGPLAGVTGTLTLFDVGQIARGGYLVEVASWSRDSGLGMDDWTVFIMSTGLCLIYQGDPASTFSLIGQYQAPLPIGFRCTTNVGGELALITQGGYFTMTNIMEGQIRPEDALSAKIRTAVRLASANGRNFFGWNVTLSPDNRLLIFNYPTTGTGEFEQHVFNTVTKAWGRWQKRNVFSTSQYQSDLYGGYNSGEVYKIETGAIDESRGDSNITGYCIQSFNALIDVTFGVKNKRVTMIQPFVEGTGPVQCSVGLWTDYKYSELQPNLNSLNPGGQFWEQYLTVNWEDWELVWGSDEGGVSTLNLSANAIGFTFAIALNADTNQTISWYSTNLTVQPGGII